MSKAPIDLQPTLVGEKVLLRPLCNGDLDALFAVASDPLIWEVHPDSERYQRPVFENFFAEAMASGGAFAVIDQDSGLIIGSTRFASYCADQDQIEIGWTFYARSHWRTGHNREVKALMLHHAYAGVKTVVFRIGADNWRSRAAVERLGAKLADSFFLNVHGKDVDYVRYNLTARDAATGVLGTII